jgi:hypothetical protein
MKFTLASILVASASAAAPAASLAEEKRGIMISTNSEGLGDSLQLFHLHKQDVDEAARKLRGSRELGSKYKKTAAPTEAPKFFFDVEGGAGDPEIMTEISGNFIGGKPTDCIGDACQGSLIARIDGEFDGCGNGSVSVGYACSSDAEQFSLACEFPDTVASFALDPVTPQITVDAFGPTLIIDCNRTIGEITIICASLQEGTDCYPH